MKLKNFLLLMVAVGILVAIIDTSPARAASEAACAIWLCLPGGFPHGCGAAHREFKNRIEKGRSPLPDLSSCTTGPNGEKASGRYEMGIERWLPCKDGYVMKESRNTNQAACYKASCAPTIFLPGNRHRRCDSYPAIRRDEPYFIKMWVDGGYLGQFFYQ